MEDYMGIKACVLLVVY